MINTTRAIHRRLRKVALTLWSLRILNATLLVLSITTFLALALAYGVVYGWRGEYILHLYTMLAIATIAIPICFLMYQAFNLTNQQKIATYIEEHDQQLNDALLTVLSAERDQQIGSPEVISALQQQVLSTLEATSVRQWVPLRIIKPGLLTTALLMACSSALYAHQGSEIFKVLELLNERPEQLSQKLAYTPLIGDIKLTIQPPSYTQLGPQFIEGGSGDFEALKGSNVTIEAILSRRATEAKLWMNPQMTETDIQDTKPSPIVFSQNGRTLKVELQVNHPFKWSVSLLDLEGVEWREAVQRRVTVKSDKPPKIKITKPVSGDRVDPSKDLHVYLEAKDDFGLTNGNIYVSLSQDMDHAEQLPLNGIKGIKWQAKDLVDLRVVQAQGGDRIALWADISDNREGESGAQKSTSEVIYLDIDSPQWAHRKLLDQLREHLELQLEALAQRLELSYIQPDQSTLTLLDVFTRWTNAHQKSTQAKAQFDELVQKVAEDPLTPQEIYLAFTHHLMQLKATLEQEELTMNSTLSQQSDQPNTAAQAIQVNELKGLERKSARVEINHENIIIIIEAMVARMALEEMSNLADELKASRANIKELMKMYKTQPSEALKSRIRRELQRFKQKMQAMRDLMAKLKKKLPEEFLNLDGMKNDEVIDTLKESESQVSSIEELLEEGKIDEAMKALDELSNSLEEMSQQLQEDMEELHRQSNPELEKALSELMDQTRDLMKAQDELTKDTQEQQNSMDKAVKDSIEKAQELLNELQEKVERIKSIEAHLNLSRSGRYIERIRADARKAAEDLERAIENIMIDEGLDAALRSQRELSTLQRIEKNSYRRRQRASSTTSQDELEEGIKLSKEVADTLEELKQAIEKRAKEAQAQVAQQQTDQRRQRQEQARKEAERAQGQPQPAAQGQPQPAAQGQPQSAAQGQPQSAAQGQPQPADHGLAQRQSDISNGLERLRSLLEKKKEKIPSLNQVPNQPFEQAQQGSKDAENQLKQHQPGRGIDGQNQVSEALKQVMKGLQQSKKPQQGQKPGQQPGGQQQSGQRDHSSTEKVEIPEQNGRGPEAMREQLLDAMKSKAARGYDDQVKAYYDSLVR